MGNFCSKEEIKYTPLHYAVKTNNLDAATTLLWRGNSIYDKDSSGESVIELCTREGSEEMKNLLLLYDERNYTLPRNI
jgi:ankyrin repeat protein